MSEEYNIYINRLGLDDGDATEFHESGEPELMKKRFNELRNSKTAVVGCMAGDIYLLEKDNGDVVDQFVMTDEQEKNAREEAGDNETSPTHPYNRNKHWMIHEIHIRKGNYTRYMNHDGGSFKYTWDYFESLVKEACLMGSRAGDIYELATPNGEIIRRHIVTKEQEDKARKEDPTSYQDD